MSIAVVRYPSYGALRKGLVLKSPRTVVPEEMHDEMSNAFNVEEQLLKRLGTHPNIVQYRGPSRTGEGMKEGLLFDEANCGNLESYMDKNKEIDDALREKWSLQITEALAHVHKKNVIHSNLGPTNVLVHQTGNQTASLLLADFGGSRCLPLGLDGQMLPNLPFHDPKSDYTSTRLDVFSLGVLLYLINAGQYPYHQGPAPQNEERFQYGRRVQALFKEGNFPDLSGVQFGAVISGCCVGRRFETAGEVVEALKLEIRWSIGWYLLWNILQKASSQRYGGTMT
ncbi:kinase-like domain-containing protein [Ampelomyces quisqualis]|uniref:Kinase-like domain-containing protein n=1 Tax=Ampelomyces quisqualis TaxID=50730 RepID=A0A6A5R4Y7_AMPQU|nr:kinase-like domain-containing protein [Ampelomyces quisqualis]